jgi:hypothetical protein
MSQLSSKQQQQRPPLLSRGGGRVGGGVGGILGISSSLSLFRFCFAMAATILLGLLVMVSKQQQQQLPYGNNNKISTTATNSKNAASASSESVKKKSAAAASSRMSLLPNEIVKGEWNGETYYHCAASSATKKKVQDIVLWHGAAFTKEEWKASGILQQLCNVDHFSVTALDLSHRSHYPALVELLHGMQKEQEILSLPLAAIVTPSASGAGIVDWINHDLDDFVQSVQLWVPVACGAVTELDPNKMEQLKKKNAQQFPVVLAIHGNQDAPGRVRSTFLQDEMGADVVELQGRHPCYLDSPDAFVETLLQRLSISSRT